VPVKVEECILCRTCESQCPEGAIQVIEVELLPAKVKTPEVEPTKTKTKRKTKKKTSPKPKTKSKKKSSP